MQIESIVEELIAERDRYNRAIEALGANPKARPAQSEKMREYWRRRKRAEARTLAARHDRLAAE
jgi:hypothetical protein